MSRGILVTAGVQKSIVHCTFCPWPLSMPGLCSSSVWGVFHLTAGVQSSMSIVHCTFCTE